MHIAGLLVSLVVLVVLSIFDIRRGIAPNYITLPYILVGIVFILIDNSRFNYVFNTLELGFILVVLFAYSKIRGKSLNDMFGGGDIKVLIGLSLMNDFYTFNLSLMAGSLVGVVWARVNSRSSIPFIPFLSAGYIIALLIDFSVKVTG